MKNEINNNVNDNNTNNNTNNINGGKKIMNNTIKANRAAEVEANRAAIKAKAREERLAAINPITIIDTMCEVANSTAHAYRNEAGNAVGTNGGKLYQEPVVNENGEMTTIAAESKEALEIVKANIAAGLSGDGMFHKTVIINGMMCECVGKTPEDLEADIAAAEDYAKAHSKGSVLRDIDVAEQLVDAEYKKEDLEQIEGSDGCAYIICYDGNYVMDLNGKTIADLSDLKSKLDKEDVKALLIGRLETYIGECTALDDYEDCDDDNYDCEDDDDECDW